MTESEWLNCEDAAAMLEVLRDRTGDRKLRLFACACARDVWSQLSEFDCLNAVEVAERFADGTATLKEMQDASTRTYDIAWSRGFCGEDARADYVAEATTREFSVHAAFGAIQNRLESQRLGEIVREIFGNPFRTATINPAWLDHDGWRVKTLAQEIYDSKAFERTPELDRALSEAGCKDESLLVPLRSGQLHYRGCWVLDTILGKGHGKDVVTEEEWSSCAQPRKLFKWWQYLRGNPPPRKRRLLASACCRRIWKGLWSEELRHAVEAAEQYADGLIQVPELAVAQARAEAVAGPVGERLGHLRPGTEEHRSEATLWSAAWAAANAAHIRGQGLYVCMISSSPVDNALDYASKYRDYEAQRGLDEQRAQCQLFRDIFGNPLRPLSIDPAWLKWNAGTVLKIAQRIYDERCFDGMPLLGDALEESGCTESDILCHCRGSEPHVLGCWLLDLILNKAAIVVEECAEAPTVLVDREL